MLLTTSFLSHNWLNRILLKRKMEGLNTTRPWAIININDQMNTNMLQTNIFKEDMYLEIEVQELPSLLNKHTDTEIIKQIINFVKTIYSAPVPYWIIIGCSTGNNKSAAIAKWISDTYLIPIEALYPGHSINTMNLSRKLYNSLVEYKDIL